jgi:hypothetical protein
LMATTTFGSSVRELTAYMLAADGPSEER